GAGARGGGEGGREEPDDGASLFAVELSPHREVRLAERDEQLVAQRQRRFVQVQYELSAVGGVPAPFYVSRGLNAVEDGGRRRGAQIQSRGEFALTQQPSLVGGVHDRRERGGVG